MGHPENTPRSFLRSGGDVAFGLGDGYHASGSMVKATVGAAVMGTVTWLTGSLWTAIAPHMIVHVNGGAIRHTVCAKADAQPPSS